MFLVKERTKKKKNKHHIQRQNYEILLLIILYIINQIINQIIFFLKFQLTTRCNPLRCTGDRNRFSPLLILQYDIRLEKKIK